MHRHTSSSPLSSFSHTWATAVQPSSHPQVELILTGIRRVKEASHSLSSSFRDSSVWWQLCPTWYRLACYTWEPYSGGARPRGSPREKFALHDQGHTAVPTCLRHVEETLVLVYGSWHPVETGADARGMDASPRGGEANLESLIRFRCTSSLLRRQRNAPSGTLWFIQLHWSWSHWWHSPRVSGHSVSFPRGTRFVRNLRRFLLPLSIV